jgi:hypothetical protein
MTNNMPAFIVVNPCVTGLHIAKTLTTKEYAQAQQIWGSQAFVVEKFSESLYNTLYSQFIQTKEFIYNLLPKMNSPEYIAAHHKFYTKAMIYLDK